MLFRSKINSQISKNFLNKVKFQEQISDFNAKKEEYIKEMNVHRDEAYKCRKEMKHKLLDFQSFILRMQKGQINNPNFNAELMKYYDSHLKNVQQANNLIDTLIEKSESSIVFLNDKLLNVTKIIQEKVEDNTTSKKRRKHKDKKNHVLPSIKALREKQAEQFQFERILQLYFYPMFPSVIQSKSSFINQQNLAKRVDYFDLKAQADRKSVV